MRIKVRNVGAGLHPNEVIVEVNTVGGTERLVVDRRSIRSNSLSVGAPLREEKDRRLVELPRETMKGLWRVWVRSDDLSPDRAATAA